MSLGEVVFAHGNHETRFDLGVVSKLKSELFYNVFYKLFDVVLADTPELKAAAHRIRYQVFCLEHEGFEDPKAHPDGQEKDAYDVHAEHALLVYRPTGRPIGTVRIVKHNAENWHQSFPMQNLCKSHYLHDETYVKNSCEFSRLCISRDLRDEIKNELRLLSNVFSFNSDKHFAIYEKPILNIALAAAPLALVRGAMEMAMNNGCLNIFGIMEPRHMRRLEVAGLVHEQIGPEMEYHGKRVPFVCNILEVFENAFLHNHEMWNIVTMKGKNHQRALDIYNKNISTAH